MNWLCARRFLAMMAGGWLGLAGCSGSNSGGTGMLGIGLTDGPIDGAEHVWIQFEGLELKRSGGGRAESYPFNPDACDDYDPVLETCTIDLLALQGIEQRTVFNQDLPVDDYEWVRLMVNAEQHVIDSYIEFPGPVQCPLWIPSGAESGLKLHGPLKVVTNGSRYILDIDLYESIIQPPGLAGAPDPSMCVENYLLRPAIRIVDNTEAGSISGVIDPSVLYDDQSAPFPGCEENMDGFIEDLKVYVFEDFDAQSPTTLDDYDEETDQENPVASVMVDYDGMQYSYEAGYLLSGQYYLGLACNAGLDDPAVDDFDGAEPALQECGSEQAPAFCFLADRTVDVQAQSMNNGDFPDVAP